MAKMCGINLKLVWGMDVHEKKIQTPQPHGLYVQMAQRSGVLAQIRSSLTWSKTYPFN